MTLGDFSEQADAYRKARPTYPAALLELLIADAQVQPGDAVVDCGAGTGILTQLLVQQGFAVTALEPNAAMRNLHQVPKADWRDGTFEESGLADQSQAWAIAAQAFHWADPPRALPEVCRVLKPNSLFTILWNNRAVAQSELLQWTEATIRQHVPEFDEAYREQSWQNVLESTGDFSFVNHRTLTHSVIMSKERFLELWKSHNRLNTIAGKERFAALLQDIDQYLNQQQLEEVDVPYHCEAWSARQNG